MKERGIYYPYTEEEAEEIARASSIFETSIPTVSALRRFAKDVREQEKPGVVVGLITGPMYLGATADEAKRNRHRISETGRRLRRLGVAVFDYSPARIRAQEVLEYAYGEAWKEEKHLKQLFDGLYEPLLMSECIEKLYLMPRWERSSIAKWNLKFAEEHGIPWWWIPSQLVPPLVKHAAAR